MTYAVFQYDRKKEAIDRLKSLSLLLLMQESKLKGFDKTYSGLNRHKIESNNAESLAGYISCWEANTNAVSIIKLASELDSDEPLEIFGEDYLGCINVKVKKSELIERVELIHGIEKNDYLHNWLTLNLSNIDKKLKTVAHLSVDELNELKEIEKKFKNPYTKWIDDREKRLTTAFKKMPKFLKRNF